MSAPAFKDDKAEVVYWEAEFEKCKKQRQTFEREWYMNMAFYFGKQYVNWTPRTSPNLSIQRLIEPPAPRYRVRLVANKILPTIRTELTKLTKEEPQFYVSPESTEPSDVAAARVGEALFEYSIDQYNFNAARRQATFWTLLCGTGYIRTSMPDPDTQDIDYLAVTAFHIFVPDLMEEDIEKQSYVMHCRAVDMFKVKQQFDTVGNMKGTVGNDNGASVENVLQNVLGVNPKVGDGGKGYLKEIWVKPGHPKYPDGAVVTICDGELLSATIEAEGGIGADQVPDNQGTLPGMSDVNNVPVSDTQPTPPSTPGYPYAHGKYPFSKMDHIPTGRFYADSSIKYLIPLQKEYNRTRSQIIESKNRMGKPQRYYQKGSIDPNKVTSEPGLMIPVMPGMEYPKDTAPVEIPSYVLQELDRTLRDMGDISGQEITPNNTPPGVEAASAIAYLQEQNDSKLYHTVASIEDAVSKIGKQTLALIQQFWAPERIIQVVSKNNTMETSLFLQADLNGNTDLHVEPGSMAPKSQAARQAFITELMKLGLLPPEKGLRYLQLNETKRLYDELQTDARQAQRENFKFSQGLVTALPINSFDDDTTHVYEHGLYMKSQEYELLEPQAKVGLEQHYLDHKLRLMPAQIPGDPNVGQQQPGLSTGLPSGGPSSNGAVPVG